MTTSPQKLRVEIFLWPSNDWQTLCLREAQKNGYPNAQITRLPNGKPIFLNAPNYHFNVSTSLGYSLAAFAAQPVGADLEPTSRKISAEKIANRWFFETEKKWLFSAPPPDRSLRFLYLWTAKEAALKLDGHGIYHGGLCNCQILLDNPNSPTALLHNTTIHLQHALLNNNFLACFAAYSPLSLFPDKQIIFSPFP
ncbi:MAG: 4'-phosphopantetheinyl transferase superfamily protein [Chthoniobacterales bacterium]|nr:4'-phosphopantetheinyl transferase superfamily protein [Chthoniobacterales bacterium]